MTPNRLPFDPNRIATPAPPPVPQTMTVSQLNQIIKQVLGDHLPGTIHLVGQISNCTHHSSGHLYMTLKDDRGEIRAVMWRSAVSSLKFKPADGLEVIATGHVDVYENRGQYQFYIRKLEPRGVGALELAFRQLYDRLAKEGLFDPVRKRPIPRYPRTIATVTSPTGAAIRDILQTIQRRWPCVRVLLHPVRVQGDGAAKEIAEAIRRINKQAAALGGIDVMIVGRGGGSLEELWAFNEEIVARAIFESSIPIISGVGHEVDTTIADLVADLRAPTPTAAAELAVPVRDDLLVTLNTHASRIIRAARHRLDLTRSRLETIERFEWFREPIAAIHRREQRLDEVVHRLKWATLQRVRHAEARFTRTAQRLLLALPSSRLNIERERIGQWLRHMRQATAHRIQSARQAVDSFEPRLEALSYRNTLARGFTITRTARGKIITMAEMAAPGDRVVTETAEGTFDSRVMDKKQKELFD